jgi:hypothetical protein
MPFVYCKIRTTASRDMNIVAPKVELAVNGWKCQKSVRTRNEAGLLWTECIWETIPKFDVVVERIQVEVLWRFPSCLILPGKENRRCLQASHRRSVHSLNQNKVVILISNQNNEPIWIKEEKGKTKRPKDRITLIVDYR